MQARRGSRSWWVVLAAITVAALAACGGGGAKGEKRAGEQEFEARLQAIVQTTRARYGELAERAGSVNPNEPLPDDFKAQMRAVAASDRRAADEIEGLTPPQPADESVRMLVAALRARADAFERAAGRMTVTLQQLEEEDSITEAGERLDRALRQLREAGFLPEEEAHD